VIGVHDELKGQVPLGLYVVNNNSTKSVGDINKEVVAMVRDRIGPIACFKDAICVQRLPKTRSGKILRSTMRAMANGLDDYKIPATIEDVTVLDEVKCVINKYLD